MTSTTSAAPSGSSSNSSSSANHYPSINIIGAGIAGLSLACHLRRRRIPYTIFEAASKPKGHNYGITISPWGYSDILSSLEPKLDVRSFRELTAVDRLTKGNGVTTATATAAKDATDFRASDMALREVLARGHTVNWNHKVVATEVVSGGLKLKFENGQDSTARITIDAGGERSGLSSLLLPELKPEILPYAVYHGSRYVLQSTFNEDYRDIFRQDENVRYIPPNPSSPWHLQLAKSYIPKSQVSSKATIHSSSSTSNPNPTPSSSSNPDPPTVEFRYTLSRPSTTQPDALFNPSRAKAEASHIPDALIPEIQTYLASLPPSLSSTLSPLFSPSLLQHDRLLNWLLRLKPVHLSNLQTLAAHGVVAIGDSAHSTPPVCSEGASLAMADAMSVVEWVDDNFGGEAAEGKLSEEVVMGFYEKRMSVWVKAGEDARTRLREIHIAQGSEEHKGKLSGRI